ncbi:hypothetical protein N0V90_003524 [Kalmusia sp. IMI 367209]|nr:hypothetical protein N0V90_003524 [Kalmusia sp. IMI 367209]
MTDIEKSFTYLHDNIPQWLKNVSEIESKIIAMQSELAKVPVSRSLPMKRRTGSIESIRDLDAIREEPESSGGAHQSEPTTRKRKTPSALSGQQSGFMKMRSRTMIVVNYDGQIQCAFEQLVRAIGTGRNMLRKGKMAAKMDAMATLANSSDEEDGNDVIMSRIGYRHRAGLSSMRSPAAMLRMTENNTSTPVERFDTADKALEQAQALCERAAHQSLREGDCRKELDGVRGHFEEVQAVAKSEVARYAAQKLVAMEKERQEAADLGSKPGKRTTIPVPDLEKEITPTTISPAIGTYSTSRVVDIEIDDDEDADEMNFVMPPIRLTSRIH